MDVYIHSVWGSRTVSVRGVCRLMCLFVRICMHLYASRGQLSTSSCICCNNDNLYHRIRYLVREQLLCSHDTYWITIHVSALRSNLDNTYYIIAIIGK